MTIVRYTLLSEGYAEQTFIPQYLNVIGKEHHIQFIRNKKLNIKPSANPSKGKVLNNLKAFAEKSLVLGNDGLFIVGIDLDEADFEGKLHSKEIESIKLLLKDIDTKDKAILFIAVQCFDHWLLYHDNKIASNSLESSSCKEIKDKLYGERRKRRDIEKKAEKIADSVDFNKLAKQSKSFSHFHQQVLDFCNLQNSKGKRIRK